MDVEIVFLLFVFLLGGAAFWLGWVSLRSELNKKK